MSELRFFPPRVDAGKAGIQRSKCKTSIGRNVKSSLLRDDHIILLAIDGFLALHKAIKWYVARRRTRHILLALDDRQLRDIGLTRSEILHTSDRWSPAPERSERAS